MFYFKTHFLVETGGLFGLAIRLMQLFSDKQFDFRPLFEQLGLLFQIRDDYANLCSKEVKKLKTILIFITILNHQNAY